MTGTVMAGKEMQRANHPAAPFSAGDPSGAEESDSTALLDRIIDLEACIAALEEDRKFRTARAQGLLAEVRALIAEAESCPSQAGHGLVERDADGRPARLEAIYDEAFLAKAAEVGLPNPRRFL